MKTQLTQDLGAVLSAEYNARVLCIDADPQASLTARCHVSAESDTLAELLEGRSPIHNTIVQTEDGFDLIPTDRRLAETEASIYTRIGRENKLRKAIRPLADKYDFCLIDCPPSLSLMTINALAAADSVLIPCLPQMADVHGLMLFLDTIDEIREEINPALTVAGIVLTFFDGRLLHHRAVVEEMENADFPLLPARIGRSIKVAEAGAAGESLLRYDPQHKILDEYRKVAKSLVENR